MQPTKKYAQLFGTLKESSTRSADHDALKRVLIWNNLSTVSCLFPLEGSESRGRGGYYDG